MQFSNFSLHINNVLIKPYGNVCFLQTRLAQKCFWDNITKFESSEKSSSEQGNSLQGDS